MLGIDVPNVSRWLDENVEGLELPVVFELIEGGRSNLTYRVTDASGHRVVLRRPPLGNVLATAHDMTNWMRAHLADGAFNDGRVLRAETLATMHKPLISNHPGVPGNAHGFWHGDIYGYKTLGHGGSIFVVVIIDRVEVDESGRILS